MNGKTIVVIGAGPAGLMAGISASSNPNNKVIIVEKNTEAGKKLLLTGGGRCNITNSCSIDDIIKNTITNGRFLFSCLNIFSNDDLMNFFKSNGLNLKVEEGGKIFPTSDKAKDVLEILIKNLQKNNAQIWYDNEVKEIIIKDNKIEAVVLNNKNVIKADSVIFASGGMSYPKTGSTGEGYSIIEKLGHTIVSIKPGLIPLEVEEKWITTLMGISIEKTSIVLNIREKNKDKKAKTIKMEGPLIFTHYGISGPVILNLSSYINKYINSDYILEIFVDLVPSFTEVELDSIFVLKEGDKHESIFKALNKMLPKNLVIKLLEALEINRELKISDLSKDDSKKVISSIKSLKITPVRLRNISEAIITSGGVSVKEINPKTMESKIINGLFFAGEIIDIDALTGGYNLQIAFSTGYVAGLNA